MNYEGGPSKSICVCTPCRPSFLLPKNCRLLKRGDLAKSLLYAIILTIGGINLEQEGDFSETLRWRLFTVDQFHYLNVTRVGTFTAFDDFDCALKCLRNPLCFSFNLAVSIGPGEKLWCELLTSDKHRNTAKYKGNDSWHHFSIMVGSTMTNIFSLYLFLAFGEN